jgi:hypothetical protein
MATIFRDPVVSQPVRKRPYFQQEIGPSVLLTTPAVVLPPSDQEFSNPVRAKQRPQDPELGSAQALITAAPVAKPFSQYEWPVSERQSKSLDAHALFTLTYFPAEVPVIPPLLENPERLPDRDHHSGSRGSYRALIEAPNPKPFSQSDWATPQRKPYRHQESTQGAQPWVLLRGEKPFAQYHWHYQERARQRQQDLSYSSPIGLLTFVEPRPFQNYDWPNPVPAAERPQESTQRSSVGLLTFVNVKPFAQYDWVTPERKDPREQLVWSFSMPIDEIVAAADGYLVGVVSFGPAMIGTVTLETALSGVVEVQPRA